MGFEQSQAMAPFFGKLARVTSARGGEPLHILHFGDSHTAADEWTRDLRIAFQRRFGNGGFGFALARQPSAAQQPLNNRQRMTPGWQSDGRVLADAQALSGVGSIGILTRRAGESLSIETEWPRVNIYYLQMPGGGGLEVFDDNRLVKQFSTDGDVEPKMIGFRTSPGTHLVRMLTTQNKPVRLLGWSNDNDSGLTYESLGINGAEASIFFRWKRKITAYYLKQREPALVVLAYGSNEASDASWTAESYHAMFSALLKRLREDCPTTSILVLGPTDRMMATRTGPIEVSGVDRIIEAQRLASRENGCAFWSAKKRMGGSGSMRDWTMAGLGQSDYVHFTPAGYDRLGEVLFMDIMRSYDSFRKSPVPVKTKRASDRGYLK